jgi:hypothetical protein
VAATTYVLIAHIPPHGVSDFVSYETSVLALLGAHGATLERRLRTSDGCVEVHVLRFPNGEALTAYRSDPRRKALAPLLARSGAITELHPVTDAPTGDD